MNQTRKLQFVHPLQDRIARAAHAQIELQDSIRFVVDIDADLASEMLAQRPDTQRKPDDASIRRFANDMARGAWRADLADPFIFDARLSLTNGQHRCSAIVAASARGGFVLRNANVVVLKTDATAMALPIDCGKKRTRQNYERAIGVDVTSAISAGLLLESVGYSRHKTTLLTTAEQAEAVANHPVREATSRVTKLSRQPAGVVAGVVRVLREAGEGEASEFFSCVFDNEQNFRGQPNAHIKFLSTWLFANVKRHYSGESFFREALFRTITAWNDHRSRKVRQVAPKFSASSEIPEPLK